MSEFVTRSCNSRVSIPYSPDPHNDLLPMTQPELVFAYLDPMSGSLILQAVIAGVLGGIVTMKRAGLGVKDVMSRAWKRIKG